MDEDLWNDGSSRFRHFFACRRRNDADPTLGERAGQHTLPYRPLLRQTGTGANYMAECIRGMPVLAAEINSRGGLLGKHPIEIIYRDSPDGNRTSPPRGEATDPQ